MATHPSPASTAPAPVLTMRAATDRCPWCDQPVSHRQFEAIQGRIAAEERERSARAQKELADRLAAQQAKIEAGAAKRIADLEASQQAALEAARRKSNADLGKAVSKARMEAAAETAKTVAGERTAREEAERRLEDLRVNQNAVLSESLRQQREVLEKDKSAALRTQQANAFRESQRLQKKVGQLQRQLDQQTAEQLGEGAEVDLYESLKAEFPDDRISRVKKGEQGADIVHQVVQNGRVCGRIVYDSKNRKAWRNEYVAKLRQDQLADQADHAILSTQAFPAGAQQIQVQDGVIVANPARVIPIVQILRRQVIQMDALRIASKARTDKSARLYDFITSDRCSQLFDQMSTLEEDILDVDVKEKKAHDVTWRNRGGLVRKLQHAQANLTSEIDQILGIATETRTA